VPKRTKQEASMTLTQLRRALYVSAKILGDVQAIRKGRIGHRLAQRKAGKLARKGLNRALKALR
jgi:hypothetical protein